MKKLIACVMMAVMVLSMAACGAKTDASPKVALVEKDGVLEAVEVENSPLKDCGIHITVNSAEGTVTFTKTDKNGADTTEYLKFTPAANEVEKYYYVSMMGTGFYYYFDLEKNEMVRMESQDHQDNTESAKENGRFDGAAATMKEEVEALQNYCQTTFGKSIADIAAGK